MCLKVMSWSIVELFYLKLAYSFSLLPFSSTHLLILCSTMITINFTNKVLTMMVQQFEGFFILPLLKRGITRLLVQSNFLFAPFPSSLRVFSYNLALLIKQSICQKETCFLFPMFDHYTSFKSLLYQVLVQKEMRMF